MKNLISNTAFGDYLRTKNITDYEYRYLRDKFDEFLKQPLELWMFIPCDTNGNPLDKPKNHDVWLLKKDTNIIKLVHQERYQQAKERVLFKGFDIEKHEHDDEGWFIYTVADLFVKDINKWRKYQSVKTIEYLLYKYQGKLHNPKVEFVLTPTALKQIGL